MLNIRPANRFRIIKGKIFAPMGTYTSVHTPIHKLLSNIAKAMYA